MLRGQTSPQARSFGRLRTAQGECAFAPHVSGGILGKGVDERNQVHADPLGGSQARHPNVLFWIRQRSAHVIRSARFDPRQQPEGARSEAYPFFLAEQLEQRALGFLAPVIQRLPR